MSKEILKEILETHSPSGYEKEMTDLIFSKLCDLDPTLMPETDAFGNVWAAFGKGPKVIMLSAHIDEIGLQVTRINDKGLLGFRALGGVDVTVLPGTRVLVGPKKIPGVIGKAPIHVTEWDKSREVPEIHNLLVDIGALTEDDALGQVKIGDLIYSDQPAYSALGETRFAGRALDDKLGMYIILEVMAKIKERRPDYEDCFTIYLVGAVQEETGLRGIRPITRRIQPSVSIDLDMCVANDEGRGISAEKYGSIKLGLGPVISVGPSYNPLLVEKIQKVALESDIPVQVSASPAGGTNTSQIQMEALSCQTALLSVPVRNMHTPVEVADWRDTESTIDLMVAVIISELPKK